MWPDYRQAIVDKLVRLATSAVRIAMSLARLLMRVCRAIESVVRDLSAQAQDILNSTINAAIQLIEANLRRKNSFSQLFSSRLVSAFRVARVFSRMSGSPISILRRSAGVLVDDLKRLSNRLSTPKSSGFLQIVVLGAILLLCIVLIIMLLL